MANTSSDGSNDNYSFQEEQDTEKSFIKKVSSRVSGLFSTSLNKLFGSDDHQSYNFRSRECDDDESLQMQPPLKKVKRTSICNDIHSSTSVEVKSGVYNKDFNETMNKNVFPEPQPGTSGIKSRKSISLHNPSSKIQNGEKDSDSGESTSGYSSMIRMQQRGIDVSNNKEAKTSVINVNSSSLRFSPNADNHMRTLFDERSLSPQTSSLCSRRPSFNTSAFGSPAFIDRTLTTKRIINSPFYNGRTTYGGLSAYVLNQQQLKNKQEVFKNRVEIKPITKNSEVENVTLGKTAKRILDTLEEYTSPISEAKKIPTPKRFKQEGCLFKYIGVNPYSTRNQKYSTPNKELLLPSVPELLKMKLKEKLQDTTENVRKIATTSKIISNDYSINNSKEENNKHTNKIRTKITSVRQKMNNCSVNPEVNLPDVKLNITTMPKIDIALPVHSLSSSTSLGSSTAIIATSTNTNIKTNNIFSTPDTGLEEYQFANPLILCENLFGIAAINDFKFSDPVFTKNDQVPCKLTAFDALNQQKFLTGFKSCESSNLKLKTKSLKDTQPISQLINKSVNDIFEKNKSQSSSLDNFKPRADTWECQVCLIRNALDQDKCAACGNDKLKENNFSKQNNNKSDASLQDFGSTFTLNSDKWECQVCLVHNINKDIKCVFCTTPKVVDNKKPTSCVVEKSINDITDFGDKSSDILNRSTPKTGFGDIFKKKDGEWDCNVCMVRNPSDKSKCMSCETPNSISTTSKQKSPLGFGNNFQKKAGEWDCNVCMVRNPSDKIMCLACETPNSNNNMKTLEPLPSKGFGDLFKKKAGEWDCSACMVRNSNEKTKCISCETPNPSTKISGNTMEINTLKQTPKFNFGIFPNEQINSCGFTPVPSNSIFGKSSSSAVKSTFTFGIPNSCTENQDVKSNLSKNSNKLIGSSAEKRFIGSAMQFSSNTASVQSTLDVTTLKTLPSTEPKVSLEESIQSNDIAVEKKSDLSLAESKFKFGLNDLKDNSKIPLQQQVVITEKIKLVSKEKDMLDSIKGELCSSPKKPFEEKIDTTTSKESYPFHTSFSQTSTTMPKVVNATTGSTVFASTIPVTKMSKSDLKLSSSTTTENEPLFPVSLSTSSTERSSKPPSLVTNLNKSVFEMPSKSDVSTKTLFDTHNNTAFDKTKSLFNTQSKSNFQNVTTTEVTPNAFGVSKSETPPFSFGGSGLSAENVVTKQHTFGALQKESVEPTKSSIFTFNAATTTDPATTGGFNFQNSASVIPKFNFISTSTLPFGSVAQNQVSMINPVQNGAFNFGVATNNNSKTGFNFGSTSTTQPPPIGTSNQINVTSSGGFNFESPSGNFAPTFNFTGGSTPTFSAQPSTSGGENSIQQRKKIRAVRRNQR